jgi:hypothetical protein
MSILNGGAKAPRRKALSSEEFSRARRRVLEELTDALERKSHPGSAFSPGFRGERRRPATMQEWDPFLDG